ncbi:hypothetical protein ACFOSC_26835 [Streptantibioticus rubrisoli]|uniref:Uncharacterized protein n=1 Tax=Streptantibioticus rubrisoli TaxID=1387313 RepID=A0ABT1PPX6_9ACTN|nr:hypothetical protein [Streptantibioticus rubrisoli]MCQ4046273.1 hypothetical protein [Streptantibioticus rubrisoli]
MTAFTPAPVPASLPGDGPLYPAYPVPWPEECDDLFSPGLIVDVALVLQQHGYPPVADLRDQAALGMHLYRFLYQGR